MVNTQWQLGDHFVGWFAAGILAALVLWVQRRSTRPNISNFPLLGASEYGSRRQRIEAFLLRPVEVYTKGYELFKHQIYRLNTPDGQSLP